MYMLSPQELVYIGIPREFHSEDYIGKADGSNKKVFYDGKVIPTNTLHEFFGECGNAFLTLKQHCAYPCKTFTCEDISDKGNNILTIFEELKKFQVLGILDLASPSKPRIIEGLLRKWFESGRSLIIYKDFEYSELKSLYSNWFIAILQSKEIR